MDDKSHIGIWLDPDTGDGMLRVVMSESLWVAIAACGWMGAVVAGLVTAWLVLP